MPCLVAIVNCTHVRSATASFKDFVKVTQENSTNQIAGILVKEQQQPPLDLVTVFQEQEVQTKQQNWEQVIVSAYNTARAIFTQF